MIYFCCFFFVWETAHNQWICQIQYRINHLNLKMNEINFRTVLILLSFPPFRPSIFLSTHTYKPIKIFIKVNINFWKVPSQFCAILIMLQNSSQRKCQRARSIWEGDGINIYYLKSLSDTRYLCALSYTLIKFIQQFSIHLKCHTKNWSKRTKEQTSERVYSPWINLFFEPIMCTCLS